MSMSSYYSGVGKGRSLTQGTGHAPGSLRKNETGPANEPAKNTWAQARVSHLTPQYLS